MGRRFDEQDEEQPSAYSFLMIGCAVGVLFGISMIIALQQDKRNYEAKEKQESL